MGRTNQGNGFPKMHRWELRQTGTRRTRSRKRTTQTRVCSWANTDRSPMRTESFYLQYQQTLQPSTSSLQISAPSLLNSLPKLCSPMELPGQLAFTFSSSLWFLPESSLEILCATFKITSQTTFIIPLS